MLRFFRYRFTFRALDRLLLPPFPGSTLRGIFGHGLRQTVCVTRQPECTQCELRRHCVYSYLFETQHAFTHERSVPHPLVLTLPKGGRELAMGDTFCLDLTLIGEANRHFPYIIAAWQKAGQRGLGRENARFTVDSVELLEGTSDNWRSLYPVARGEALALPSDPPCYLADTPAPEAIQVTLITPYRSKRKGKLVTHHSFEPSAFLIALIRRIAQLQRLHDPQGKALETEPLIAMAKAVRMPSRSLQWHDWVRRSSRQQTLMNMGGVIGRFTLTGDALQPLWPLLQLGQWIHTGKNTLFGLGQYAIETDRDEHG
jgi:hypothetical protein